MRPKSLLRAIIIFLAAVFILLPLSACDKDNFTGPTDTQAVYMKGDGAFKILTVTDSHINGEKSYQFLRQTLERLIDAHNPDLIVFNGDNVDAEKYLVHLEKIALFLEGRQIYWAAVLGNHDRDPEVDGVSTGLYAQNRLLESYNRFNRENAYCLYVENEKYYAEQLNYQNYPREGNDWNRAKFGNYAVQIKNGEKTVYSLVFLDSGQHMAAFHKSNGYIEKYQVDWYKQYITDISRAQKGKAKLKREDYIPSMVFFHQPILEYIDAAKYALDGEESGYIPQEFGFGKSSIISGGTQNEDYNYNLFDAMKEVGGTHVFAGHVHNNNSSILYDGIWVNHLHRVGRRGSEDKTYPNYVSTVSKLITIDPVTNEVDMFFALPGGYTTKDIADAYEKNKAR